MHRREVAGRLPEDAPPPVPPEVSQRDLHGDDQGVGPLFHRRFSTRIRQGELSPEELFARVSGDLNGVAPTSFARFVKVQGDEGTMRVGDEFVVRIPGPWDGPVRVVDVSATSFRLATLVGHLEAGQIEFRAGSATADGQLSQAEATEAPLTFEIEAWARSGDRLSRVLYERARMAKEVQLHMWTSVLERVVRLSGGRMTGGVVIDTRRVDDGGP